MKLCFATNNRHKLEEISRKLGAKYQLIRLEDIGHSGELPENQDTLEGNSLEKARYIYDRYHINCFADDTGLLISALNGAPGVYSARYAGPGKNPTDNMQLLLKNMEGKTNRAALFKTVITLILEGKVRQFEGIVHGTITKMPKGAGGFGYDPVFLPAGHDKTFAEMHPDEKNRISHRTGAVNHLVHYLMTTEL